MPDWHWRVVNECWKQKTVERPAFKGILERLREKHQYILNENVVREVKDFVDREVCEPTGQD
jgi:hypothetical protein